MTSLNTSTSASTATASSSHAVISTDNLTVKHNPAHGMDGSMTVFQQQPPATTLDSGSVQAYAKLEGEDFCYYIRTLQVTLGRKVPKPENIDIPLGTMKSVSRHHARLFYNFATQRFELMVFGKNGAFVNEQFVEKGATVPLENRTKIQIGDVSFVFLLPRMDVEEPTRNESFRYISRPQQLEKHSSSTWKNQVDKRPQPESSPEKMDSPEASPAHGKDTKPPYSYATLIAQAINSTEDKRMTLNGIYTYINKHYPYFKMSQNGWQNSIRHNLSLNKAFVKVPRGDSEPGKGAFWTIDSEAVPHFLNGIYKKTKRMGSKGASGSDGTAHEPKKRARKDEDAEEDTSTLPSSKDTPSAETVKGAAPSLVAATSSAETDASSISNPQNIQAQLQQQLQSTIRQHLLDPVKYPLPASIAQLLPQAIAQLPPQLASQLSSTLQTALRAHGNSTEQSPIQTTLQSQAENQSTSSPSVSQADQEPTSSSPSSLSPK